MAFTVTRSSGVMVLPSQSTPRVTLDLSVIDKLPVLRLNVRSLHVFGHGGGPVAGKVLRDALSKALVPYHPLAGRLQESSAGELQVSCTGEGAWFIEASTDCTLDSLNYVDDVFKVQANELLPITPPEASGLDPLIQIQVTSFTCEGFTVGLVSSHTVLDGMGAAQFLKAVGEFARGFPHPTVTPVWQREAIPTHAGLKQRPPISPPTTDYKLEHTCTGISQDQLNKFKGEFSDLTGESCTTFEVTAATIWRERIRSMDLEKSTDVKLIFTVNTREYMEPPLPEGFYGNCFFFAKVEVSSGWLVNASIAKVVKLVKDAKSRVPTEFMAWLKSEVLEESDDPFACPLSYTTFCLTEWRRLGLDEVDYGWGKPVNFLPMQDDIIMPNGVVGYPPAPKEGVRLWMWCVTKAHLPFLVDQLVNLS